ncbi:hypothetical protein VTL71DRAFT_13357 [Oculimacula yallundae]|uniref:Uncharacterized protein n=1 Tax=Oculimacula yallundae TaxID=86028 RepID=A0ABR4CK29_9HELO
MQVSEIGCLIGNTVKIIAVLTLDASVHVKSMGRSAALTFAGCQVARHHVSTVHAIEHARPTHVKSMTVRTDKSQSTPTSVGRILAGGLMIIKDVPNPPIKYRVVSFARPTHVSGLAIIFYVIEELMREPDPTKNIIAGFTNVDTLTWMEAYVVLSTPARRSTATNGEDMVMQQNTPQAAQQIMIQNYTYGFIHGAAYGYNLESKDPEGTRKLLNNMANSSQSFEPTRRIMEEVMTKAIAPGCLPDSNKPPGIAEKPAKALPAPEGKKEE